MSSGHEGGGALSYVPLRTIKSWYAKGIFQLIRHMAVDSVLVKTQLGG